MQSTKNIILTAALSTGLILSPIYSHGRAQTPHDYANIEPAAGPSLTLGAGLLLAGVGAAIAVGMAGDGGGGDDDENGRVPVNPLLLDPIGEEVASSFGLPIINAFDAYDRGYTGNGIQIGIVDTGFLTEHDEFSGNIDGCYNAITDETGCENSDDSFHGGHVAGIAAASKDNVGMHGVAYNATIYNADIFYGNTVAASNNLQANAIDRLVAEGTQISNHSYGFNGSHKDFTPAEITALVGPGTDIYTSYQNAIANDLIFVWAAGNDNETDPSLSAALPIYYPEYEDLWVSVVAVKTTNGELASYSNACGDASDFCLAAPGGDSDGGIFSTSYRNNKYAFAAGTSMAAPHVAGGLALVMEAFGPGTVSNLSAEEVVDIIFKTADNSGIYADTNIYGQGLLDLDAATSPTAPLAFATMSSFSSVTLPVAGTRIAFGPAFGEGPSIAMNGLSAGAHDKYGRIFKTDLSSFVTPRESSFNSAKILGNFGTTDIQTIRLNNQASLELAYGQNPVNRGNAFDRFASDQHNTQAPFKSLSYTTEVGSGEELAFHYGSLPGKGLGLQSNEILQNSPLAAHEQSLNPYLDFAGSDAVSSGFAKSLTDRMSINTQVFMSTPKDENPLFDNGQNSDSAFGTAIETRYKVTDALTLSAIGGSLQEDENILGTSAEGAFDLQNDTNSFFTGVNFDVSLNDNLNFFGGWQGGWTNAASVENSLFDDFSTIKSDSFTLGLTGRNAFSDTDQWGLVVHQPVRVSSANADIKAPIARSDNGSVIYNEQSLDLSPEGREINLQAFYKTERGYNSDISAGLVYRTQPNHDKNADPEGIGLVRYNLEF